MEVDTSVLQISPPTLPATRGKLYTVPITQLAPANQEPAQPRPAVEHTRTPSSTHGDSSPTGAKSKGWKPLKAAEPGPAGRLDLS
jgi:hypothetical protein